MKAEWTTWAKEARERFPQANSALMPLLHRIQQAEAWLDEETLADVADLLELPVQYVQSVASFYSLFYQERVGRRVIHVCVGLSCALAGADALMHELEEKLGISAGQTTRDGAYSLREAECLAACDLAPVAQVNLRFHGRVSPGDGDRLLSEKVST
ncbi:MAG: NAD(P)H-dependent oxidoreductase subunit E [Thermaerobacter sp.]|nr:NAD(P)H-dependent oxidoreductase subunit E [Thermaerobacter sp.]